MKAIIRKDEQAVSPVIATILMVAITVVLAAVLYVMVSGLISTPQTTQQVGVAVTRSGDGTNWIMTFTTVPTGLGLNTTYVSLVTAAGASTNITNAGLGTLIIPSPNHGVKYYPSDKTYTSVSPNDRLTVFVLWFPSGTQYSITNSNGILAKGTLQ